MGGGGACRGCIPCMRLGSCSTSCWLWRIIYVCVYMHANVYANGLVYKRARVSACVCASWVRCIHSLMFLFFFFFASIFDYSLTYTGKKKNMTRIYAPPGPFQDRARRLSDTRKQEPRSRVRELLDMRLTRSRGTPSVPPSKACAGALC